MAKMEAGFIKERAQQLAIVYLTRRDDVLVTKNPAQFGPSLLVSLLDNGQDVGRYLGVEVGGTVSERELKRAEQTVEVRPNLMDFPTSRDTPFPVCLFFFTMRDDEGYWKWVREPICDSQRGGALSLSQNTALVRLTNQELETIWTSVEEWYQMRQQLVAA